MLYIFNDATQTAISPENPHLNAHFNEIWAFLIAAAALLKNLTVQLLRRWSADGLGNVSRAFPAGRSHFSSCISSP